jgi:hypothetical protein
VKKKNQETVLFENKEKSKNKDISINNSDIINKTNIHKNKTTNVNILLNRVRLDKKKNLRKKLIFTSILIIAISSLGIFIVI